MTLRVGYFLPNNRRMIWSNASSLVIIPSKHRSIIFSIGSRSTNLVLFIPYLLVLASHTALQTRCKSSAWGEYTIVPLGSFRFSIVTGEPVTFISSSRELRGGLRSLPDLLCSCGGRFEVFDRRCDLARFLRGRFGLQIFRDLFDVPLAQLVTCVFAIRVAFEGAEDAAQLFAGDVEFCGYVFRGHTVCHKISCLSSRLGRGVNLSYITILSYQDYLSMANKKIFFSVLLLFVRAIRILHERGEGFRKSFGGGEDESIIARSSSSERRDRVAKMRNPIRSITSSSGAKVNLEHVAKTAKINGGLEINHPCEQS